MSKIKKCIILLSVIVVAIISIFLIGERILSNQICEIVESSAVNNGKNHSKYISYENAKKISQDIIDNCETEKLKNEKVKCSIDEMNIFKGYAWVTVNYSNNVIDEDNEYYKCYFKLSGGRVYITRVGLDIADDGTITDLD